VRILLAVKSCQAHCIAGYHEAILNTWGKNVPSSVNLQFFIGDTEGYFESKDNQTIYLDAPDDYMSLPLKTKAIVRWSLWNQYDYTFLCDTDTFIIPDRLLRCGFEKFDYSGRFGTEHLAGITFHYQDPKGNYLDCHPWASGGVGYFLSRKAAEIIVRKQPKVWAEDMFVGQALGPHIQTGVITASDLSIECQCAWHFPRRQYNNQVYDPKFGWMQEMQKQYGVK